MINEPLQITRKTGRNFADKGVKAPGVLHRITLRNATHTALFFYVQGQQKIHPELSISLCVESFAAAFLPDADTECLRVEYYRMLHEYLNERNIFNGYSNTTR